MKINANHKQWMWQFLKYGIVGVMNTLITLAIIFFMMDVLKTDYRISNATGYLAGFINSFFMNKHWTFKSKGRTYREALLFTLVFAVAYAIQYVALILLHKSLGISKNLSQLLSACIYTFFGFIGNRLFTFKNLENQENIREK